MSVLMKSVLKASPNQPPEAEAGRCATLRLIGTGSRATPWFEGAHYPSKMRTVFKSANLGKPRRFLRRCAPFFEGAQLFVSTFASRGTDKSIKAEAGRCATLRVIGTGSRAVPWRHRVQGQGPGIMGRWFSWNLL